MTTRTRTKVELEKLRDDATPPPWVHAGTNSDTDEVRLEHGGFPEKGYSHWSYMRAEDARLVEAAHENLAQLIEAKATIERLLVHLPDDKLLLDLREKATEAAR